MFSRSGGRRQGEHDGTAAAVARPSARRVQGDPADESFRSACRGRRRRRRGRLDSGGSRLRRSNGVNRLDHVLREVEIHGRVHQTTFGREDEIDVPLLRDTLNGRLQLRQELLLQLLRQALDILLRVLSLALSDPSAASRGRSACAARDVSLSRGPPVSSFCCNACSAFCLSVSSFCRCSRQPVDPGRRILAFSGLRRHGLDVDPPELATFPERDGRRGRRLRQRRGWRRVRLFRRRWRLSSWGTRRRRVLGCSGCRTWRRRRGRLGVGRSGRQQYAEHRNNGEQSHSNRSFHPENEALNFTPHGSARALIWIWDAWRKFPPVKDGRPAPQGHETRHTRGRTPALASLRAASRVRWIDGAAQH